MKLFTFTLVLLSTLTSFAQKGKSDLVIRNAKVFDSRLMAEPFGLTYFTNKLDTTLSTEQLTRCRANFEIFMVYIKTRV